MTVYAHGFEHFSAAVTASRRSAQGGLKVVRWSEVVANV
jgi:hypothetical protein